MRRVRAFVAAACLLALACLTACGTAAPAARSGSGEASSATATSATTSANADGSTAKTPSKTVVVGYESYPPSCFLDEAGNPSGIDMDIATEAFKRLGLTPVFKEIDWIDKDDLLAAGEIDCVWCSFSMLGREDDYTWAGPYMCSDEVVVVSEGSPITSLADLNGKIVGVAATTEPERVLLDRPSADIPDVESVCSLQDASLLYSSLLKGYVDAIATHRLAAEQYIADYGVNARILDEPLVHVKVGVAFAKDTTSTVPSRLDRTLSSMKRDGTIKRILSRYVEDPDDFLEVDDE